VAESTGKIRFFEIEFFFSKELFSKTCSEFTFFLYNKIFLLVFLIVINLLFV